MEEWVVGIENYLTVISPATVDLKAFYARPHEEYTSIVGVFTKVGSDRYFIKHTFTAVGMYIIRIEDASSGVVMANTTVSVVAASLESSTNSVLNSLTVIQNGMSTKGDVYAASLLS